jgi:hypothetical protein
MLTDMQERELIKHGHARRAFSNARTRGGSTPIESVTKREILWWNISLEWYQ